MHKKELIKKILSIPRDFYELRNVTVGLLLEKSGYLENHQAISQADIEDCLKENSNPISYWLQYSDDQRSVPALLFYESKLRKGHYEVSSYSKERGLELLQEFPDIKKACTFYILKMIESWRSSLIKR